MAIYFDLLTGETFKYKTIRENKGKSLLDAPNSYCVIDIETTGLSPNCDSIIEVAAIRYQNHQIVDTFSSLIKPDDFDEEFSENGWYLYDFITELTGITDDMLKNAEKTGKVLSKYRDFIGNNILVGHNVNFDINFLYDNFKYYLNYNFTNNFIDTMRISRRIIPDLPHHRLQDLVKFFNIDYSNAHRAAKDCLLTAECYFKLIEMIKLQYGTIEAFKDAVTYKYKGIKASDISALTDSFDTSHPIYGKVCVFTGTLEKMLRKDAMQIVANLGGINADNVTKKTNYLILGNNDYCKTIKDGKSAKQKKAETLKLKGQDIEIIPENVFYDMIIID